MNVSLSLLFLSADCDKLSQFSSFTTRQVESVGDVTNLTNQMKGVCRCVWVHVYSCVH